MLLLLNRAEQINRQYLAKYIIFCAWLLLIHRGGVISITQGGVITITQAYVYLIDSEQLLNILLLFNYYYYLAHYLYIHIHSNVLSNTNNEHIDYITDIYTYYCVYITDSTVYNNNEQSSQTVLVIASMNNNTVYLYTLYIYTHYY